MLLKQIEDQVCALRAVPGMISWSRSSKFESPVVRGLPVPSGVYFYSTYGHPLFAGFVKAASEFQKRQRSK